jgi:hypothetical protein
MLNMTRVLQSNQQVNAKHDEGIALKQLGKKCGRVIFGLIFFLQCLG